MAYREYRDGIYMANSNSNDNGNPHVTEYCVMCRRPDTAAGKMIHMPGNICVCSDCMQKMMDFAGNMDFSNMQNVIYVYNNVNYF